MTDQRRTYRVELRGDSREVYVIEAISEEDARARWHEGSLLVQESFGMAVEEVTLDD